MIDKEELLDWIDQEYRLIYFRFPKVSKDVETIHSGYMELFREHVKGMPDKKPTLNVIDGLIFGFAAGLLVATMIRLLG